MSTSNQKSLLYKASCLALAATVFGAISFVTASDAEARERSRTGSYITGKGKTGSFQSSRSRTKGEGYMGQMMPRDTGDAAGYRRCRHFCRDD